MKRFSLLCLLALTLCTVATANIIPTSITITGTGPYTWTYDLQLSRTRMSIVALPRRSTRFRISTLTSLGS